MATMFGQNQGAALWRELKSVVPQCRKLPKLIDNVTGEQNIAELWRAKYEGVLNCVDDNEDRTFLEATLEDYP